MVSSVFQCNQQLPHTDIVPVIVCSNCIVRGKFFKFLTSEVTSFLKWSPIICCPQLNQRNNKNYFRHLILQRIINDLFQYAERLQERKADRENVATEMDVKADKHALDGKVNQSTFDETFQMFDRGTIDEDKI